MKVGDSFSSYEELEEALDLYKKSVCNEYWIRDARTLANQKKRFPDTVSRANESLKYYYIRLACVKGGRPFKSKNEKSLRKSTTLRQDCEATIFIRLSHCQTVLTVIEINDNHNHNAESYINSLLELPETVKSCPKVSRHKKNMIEEVQIKSEYKTTLRDLANLSRGTEKKCLAESLDLLHNLYNCDVVETLIDQNGIFKGLYFQDGRMKKYFEAYPEIVIIDETFSVTALRIATYIVMVGDSNGLSEVVAVCLLIDDNQESLDIFIEIFKKYNPSWLKVKVVMSDKNKIGKKIFQRHFPFAKFMISLFHIFESFSGDISVKSMEISTNEAKVSKMYFDKLVFANSEDEYNGILKEMLQNVPDFVKQYYEVHWAPVVDQWVKYLTFQNLCLPNTITNPLENLNSVLESVIHQYSSLEDFIQHFFIYINSYRAGQEVKVSEMQHKQLETPLEIGSVKSLYHTHLTAFAYEIVENQLAMSNFCDLKSIDHCTFLAISTEGFLQVTQSTCECLFWKISQLPCRHIFKCREVLLLPLFDASLCLDRWTKIYSDKVQQSCKYCATNNVVMYETSDTDKTPVKVSDVTLPTTLTSDEKFEIIDDQGKLMAHMCSDVSTPVFHKRLDFIQNVMKLWSEGKDSMLNEHFTKLFKRSTKKSKKNNFTKQLKN